MASVYKKGRDKRRKHAHYYIDYLEFVNGRNVRKCVTGFTDRGESEKLAAKLEDEAERRRSGLIDPELERLAKLRQSSLEDHLVAFETSVRRGKRTEKHVKLLMSRVRRVLSECEAKTPADLRTESVEQSLHEMREEDGFGHRTFNHYVQAIEQFSNWLTTKLRLSAHPVKGIKRLNNETDVRRRRRALTAEELEKLIAAARTSEEIVQGYDGDTRARIYTIAALTGLRKNEIASLRSRSFDLEAKQPTLIVEAKDSKHRKKDVLPLHPQLVDVLRGWVADLAPDQPLFPKLGGRKTWLMVQKDLAKAGILYETSDGTADFHAAGRHTFITNLISSGASITQARKLARHEDVKMTMRYTHVGMQESAAALAAMPCQHIVSIPGVSESAGESSVDAAGQDDTPEVNAPTPSAASRSDAKRRKKASPVEGDASWRRRGSNPRPEIFPQKRLRA